MSKFNTYLEASEGGKVIYLVDGEAFSDSKVAEKYKKVVEHLDGLAGSKSGGPRVKKVVVDRLSMDKIKKIASKGIRPWEEYK